MKVAILFFCASVYVIMLNILYQQPDTSFTDKLNPPVIVVMSIKDGTIFMVKYGKNGDSIAECPKNFSKPYILKYKVGDTIKK